MTSSARVNRDTRMAAAGLAAHSAVILPAIITATGRAAPSQFAIVPTAFPASFALLPYVDYDDAPDLRPGGGFVGGRLASVMPYLSPGAITAADDIRVVLRTLPTSREAIRDRLRGDAGLHFAPGAMFSLAAWEDERVYVWLDHLRRNGTDARLVIAVSQAMLAVRRMWLRIIWNAGAQPASDNPGLTPSLSSQCGAVAVGRALLDVVHVLLRLVGDAQAERTGIASGAASAAPMRRVRVLLGEFVDLIVATEGHPKAYARKKLIKAIKSARTLLDAVASFSVAAEPLEQRWRRLDMALSSERRDAEERLAPLDLAGFDARLNALPSAKLGTRLEATVWPNRIRRSLLRLASPDGQVRLAGLDRFRGDLLYKLLITRRLDRSYALFPWLGAPHGAFFECAGGALGALASLLECGRRMEVAHELKRQVADASTASERKAPAMVDRLTIHAARATWASRYLMKVAVDRGYAAGIALDQNAISHATITAGLEGTWFGRDHPIAALRFGRLDWSLPAAMRDRRTVATIQRIEKARPVMWATKSNHDLPRHRGMTVKRLIAEIIISVFPSHVPGGASKTSDHGPFATAKIAAVMAVNGTNRPIGDFNQPLYAATSHLARSMLLTLDVAPATDPKPRDAMADNEVSPPLAGTEMDRVEARRKGATRKAFKNDDAEKGQNLRRTANAEPTMADARGKLLRELADDIARWREPKRAVKMSTLINPSPDGRSKPPRYAGTPRDDLLDEILRGRRRLQGLTPVGSLALPLLWLAPLIDREIVAWIARGAAPDQAPGGASDHSAAIASEVARVHGWASLLYARALPTYASITAACHLFTGHSTITADLSLA